MNLAGRGIVVTRPRELAEPFARLLEQHGARAFLFPAIEIQPLPAPAALGRIAEFDLAIFVSPSAVRVAAASLPRGLTAAAIGAGTARELERAGVGQVIAPEAGADSESLLAMPQMRQLAGKRVLIVRGEGGRELLGQSLSERGARVEYAECYRRARPATDAGPLLAAWRRGEVHAVTVLSPQTLDNFMSLTGGALVALPFFVPHERIARHARERGLGEVIVAERGDDGLIERLVAYFHGRD